MLVPLGSNAHHSSAMYDDKQSITMDGAVTNFEWANPHVYIYIKQMTSDGEIFDWKVEASPPSVLGRLGWSRDTLKIGDTILVIGRPARDPGKKSLLPSMIKRVDATLFD